jgi:hypothetical protein
VYLTGTLKLMRERRDGESTEPVKSLLRKERLLKRRRSAREDKLRIIFNLIYEFVMTNIPLYW